MLKISMSEVDKNDLNYFEKKIIDSIKQLISYNPTYDLKYLFEVTRSTIGQFIREDYGIAFTGSYMLITRMSDYKYITEITETAIKSHKKEPIR